MDDCPIFYETGFGFLGDYFDRDGHWDGPAYSGLDIETEGLLNPHDGEIATVQIELSDCCYVVHWNADQTLLDVDYVELFMQYLQDKRVTKVIHNAAFEQKWLLHHLGENLTIEPVHDTMAGEYILAEGVHFIDDEDGESTNRVYFSLGDVVLKRYGVEMDKDQALRTSFRRRGFVEYEPQPDLIEILEEERISTKTGKVLKPRQVKIKVSQPDKKVVRGDLSIRQLNYAAFDALWVARLAQDQIEEMTKIELEKGRDYLTLLQLDSRTSEAVGRMELAGMPVDLTKLEAIDAEWAAEVTRLEEELQEVLMPAGSFTPVSLNSRQQMVARLQELGYPVDNYKKGTLKRFEGDWLIDTLLKWKTVNKRRGTYSLGLLNKYNPRSKAIHPYFNQFVTATGRLSSSNPNGQNLPPIIRSVFVAPPGYSIISADYSNIELRLIAEIYHDEAMLEAFCAGLDVHHLLAIEILKSKGIVYTYEEFCTLYKAEDPECMAARKAAKPANFGLGYGAGWKRLIGIAWEQYGLVWNEEFSKFMREAYLTKWAGVKAYHEHRKQEIKRGSGAFEVETLSGRARRWPDRYWTAIDPETGEKVEKSCYSGSLNHPIQGTSADMAKEAMWELCRDTRMIAMIHDQLLFLERTEHAQATAKRVKDTMEAVGRRYLKIVPCIADVAITDVWKK